MALSTSVLTVTQLTSAVKEILELGFPQIVVEGEISGLRSTQSKHLYFNLKDEKSLVKIVWFNWNSRGTVFEPQDGQQVRISGRLTVYEAQGNYQIVVSSIESVGLGDLLAKLERLKRTLESEGLFDASRKRPIPLFPATIGLVTSPTGAALQDILRILRQNPVYARIRIFPVLVQGQEAPAQIVAALDLISKATLADVVVLGRGGGSLEDLLAFSDENVVRAIARSQVPIISAVGHEIDTPLSDFAADLRAPTPTAAAEWLARPWSQLEPTIALRKQEFREAIVAKLDKARSALKDFRRDRLEETFRSVLQPKYQRLDDAKEDLLRAMSQRLLQVRTRLELQKASLEALNPLSVLERGYSVVTDSNGKAIQSSQSVSIGEKLQIRFHEGQATAVVEEKQ